MISFLNSKYEDGLYHLLRGLLFLHETNIEQAKIALETAESRFETGSHNVEYVKSQLLLAAAYDQGNKSRDAIHKLKAVFKDGSQLEHPILVFVQQIRTWLEGLQSNAEIGFALRNILSKADNYKEMPSIAGVFVASRSRSAWCE
jgi:hypothetical protein